MGCIGKDSDNKTRRSREESISDELPNLPDNNTGTAHPSDEGDLMGTIPGSVQNSELGNVIHVDDDTEEGTTATYAM